MKRFILILMALLLCFVSCSKATDTPTKTNSYISNDDSNNENQNNNEEQNNQENNQNDDTITDNKVLFIYDSQLNCFKREFRNAQPSEYGSYIFDFNDTVNSYQSQILVVNDFLNRSKEYSISKIFTSEGLKINDDFQGYSKTIKVVDNTIYVYFENLTSSNKDKFDVYFPRQGLRWLQIKSSLVPDLYDNETFGIIELPKVSENEADNTTTYELEVSNILINKQSTFSSLNFDYNNKSYAVEYIQSSPELIYKSDDITLVRNSQFTSGSAVSDNCMKSSFPIYFKVEQTGQILETTIGFQILTDNNKIKIILKERNKYKCRLYFRYIRRDVTYLSVQYSMD